MSEKLPDIFAWFMNGERMQDGFFGAQKIRYVPEAKLAAAHRAGAIEALDWLISQYQQQIGVIKQHRESYAAVGHAEYVNVMNQELSGLRNARWTAIVAKSRYAEPEEEQEP